MAIIVSGSAICPICGTPVDLEETYLLTTAFLEASNELYKYSDAALHWKCYLNWKHRESFAKQYAEAIQAEVAINPYWHPIFEDNDVFIKLADIGFINILLKKIATQIQIELNKLDDWLREPTSSDPIIQEELTRVKEKLLNSIATSHLIYDKTLARSRGAK